MKTLKCLLYGGYSPPCGLENRVQLNLFCCTCTPLTKIHRLSNCRFFLPFSVFLLRGPCLCLSPPRFLLSPLRRKPPMVGQNALPTFSATD